MSTKAGELSIVFAGVAFMIEHDLHLLTGHAKHWEHDLGDVRHHADDLVRALEDEFGTYYLAGALPGCLVNRPLLPRRPPAGSARRKKPRHKAGAPSRS